MKPELDDRGISPAHTEDVNRQYLLVFLGLCLSAAIGVASSIFGGELAAQVLPGAAANSAFVATSLVVMIVLLVLLGLSAFRQPRPRPLERASYEDRLSELTAQLIRVSREVDAILLEEIQVIRDRVADTGQLGGTLAGISSAEEALQGRADALKEIPLSVADQLTTLTENTEQRSTRRDTVLFAWGMVLGYFLQIIPGLLRG